MQTTSPAMAFRPAVAIFDACVLYPFHLRNIVVQAAVDRLVDARWTDAIQDEWIRNLVADKPSIPIERLRVTRQLMESALPDATVRGYEAHIDAVTLPDPDDRHVVAAGIVAGASLILTWNVRDFPTRELAKHGLHTQTPDAFMTELYETVPHLTLASLAHARRNLKGSRVSPPEFIEIVSQQRLAKLTTRVARHRNAI